MSSKVAEYLQGHIYGELSIRKETRKAFSYDSGILSVEPEVIAYPRSTNDVRKITRFAWQLAEKGHIITVAPRGFGLGVCGGSLTDGVSLVLSTHMNRVFEYDARQQLVRVQSGASVSALQDALATNDAWLPTTDRDQGTIGAVVSNNTLGRYAGAYDTIMENVSELEVVTATGEIIQTKRLSRRELKKKCVETGFEAEIYRKIDTLIEDNPETIAKIAEQEGRDHSGYPGIAQVKDKKGSFDLGPLFIGAQGTLGVITEMILNTESMSPDEPHLFACVFESMEKAVEFCEQARQWTPSLLEVYDYKYVEASTAHGRMYDWLNELVDEDEESIGAIVLVEYQYMKIQKKFLKKCQKYLDKNDIIYSSSEIADYDALMMLRDSIRYMVSPGGRALHHAPAVLEGWYVPHENILAFTTELADFAATMKVEMPLYGSCLTGIYGTRVSLSPKTVADQQKLFKLMEGAASLVQRHDGYLVGDNAEGILYSRAARAAWDDDVRELYDAIREVFDPKKTLNAQAKAPVELKKVVSLLRSDATPSRPEIPGTL